MALSFSVSTAELRAINLLGDVSNELGKTLERLASGSRINNPGDDPAGLQVAEKLRVDSRLATQALRNANDGVSLTAVTVSALDEAINILQRMSELAEQSANEVFTNDQRSVLSNEFQQLGSEIERIAQTTQFNRISLLSNSETISLQVGLDSSESSRIDLAPILGTLESVGLANVGTSEILYSLTGNTVAEAASASRNALTALSGALDSLNSRRGTLGAAESRLSSAINLLEVTRENYLAAESRIRDIDVAQEVAKSARLQVQQQATVAVLAQARLEPQVVLALLQ